MLRRIINSKPSHPLFSSPVRNGLGIFFLWTPLNLHQLYDPFLRHANGTIRGALSYIKWVEEQATHLSSFLSHPSLQRLGSLFVRCCYHHCTIIDYASIKRNNTNRCIVYKALVEQATTCPFSFLPPQSARIGGFSLGILFMKTVNKWWNILVCPVVY